MFLSLYLPPRPSGKHGSKAALSLSALQIIYLLTRGSAIESEGDHEEGRIGHVKRKGIPTKYERE